MPPQTATLLMPRDIGVRWGRRQALELAAALERRLAQPVVVCSDEDEACPLAVGIQTLVDDQRDCLVILPLGLLPVPTRGTIAHTLDLATRQWPNLSIHTATPLTWLEWAGWLHVTAVDAIKDSAVASADIAILLVGQSSSNPLTNADVARIAHLMQEAGSFSCVSHAFLGTVRPDVLEAMKRFAYAGVRHVVVIPWLIADEQALKQLNDEIDFAVQVDGLDVTLSSPSLAHPALVNLLVSNHYAALSLESVATDAGSNRSSPSAERGIARQDAFELQELERRINSMLPSEYQGKYESVKPRSMGTAALKLDGEGKVAWGEIWTSFCDLALAGGPPHRGTLLEAVPSSEALAEPELYAAVVAEIERGIGLVTTLPVVSSKTPGWVGIRCDSEEMAVWVMRAIIVENIMVRREGDILFLPAGPRFTVKREIKNVITAVAKTVHYWSAHLVSRRPSAMASS